MRLGAAQSACQSRAAASLSPALCEHNGVLADKVRAMLPGRLPDEPSRILPFSADLGQRHQLRICRWQQTLVGLGDVIAGIAWAAKCAPGLPSVNGTVHGSCSRAEASVAGVNVVTDKP